MTLKGILDNFSRRFLVRILDEELSQIVFVAKCYRNLDTPAKELAFILENVMPRWNTALKDESLGPVYTSQIYITLAAYLRKFGYADPFITASAIEGLRKFEGDEYGFMPSHQYKKAVKAIELLSAPAEYHTKKPGHKATVTQYRAGDRLSIRLGDKYAAAYVTEVTDVYEALLMAVYDNLFDAKPTAKDLAGIGWTGEAYRVSNLNYNPDPAGQFDLIGNTPDLYEEKTGWIGSDIYSFLSSAAKALEADYLKV
ncbi:MAG: hypothetical protein ACPGVT_11445 [Maricaulaceae bacterium]